MKFHFSHDESTVSRMGPGTQAGHPVAHQCDARSLRSGVTLRSCTPFTGILSTDEVQVVKRHYL